MRLHIRSIARITRQWFRERGIHTFKWPANSPDLNPIESIWCQMKDVIPKRYPEYLPQRLLEQAVLDVWNAISEHSLRAQLETMPRRLPRRYRSKWWTHRMVKQLARRQTGNPSKWY